MTPLDITRFPEFLISLLRWKPHIQSAENLSDRSLEDIGLAPHGANFAKLPELLRK